MAFAFPNQSVGWQNHVSTIISDAITANASINRRQHPKRQMANLVPHTMNASAVTAGSIELAPMPPHAPTQCHVAMAISIATMASASIKLPTADPAIRVSFAKAGFVTHKRRAKRSPNAPTQCHVAMAISIATMASASIKLPTADPAIRVSFAKAGFVTHKRRAKRSPNATTPIHAQIRQKFVRMKNASTNPNATTPIHAQMKRKSVKTANASIKTKSKNASAIPNAAMARCAITNNASMPIRVR